jgi:hypothetical protein
MFDLRLADGLSQNPSASTAALKSGASRARYAAMGLDRGEASETIGNDAVDAHLCPHCGHRRYVTLLLCSETDISTRLQPAGLYRSHHVATYDSPPPRLMPGTGGWERYALPPSAIGIGSGIMKKIFATLAVLSLVAGTVALLAPANASSTWLFQGTSNQGNGS